MGNTKMKKAMLITALILVLAGLTFMDAALKLDPMLFEAVQMLILFFNVGVSLFYLKHYPRLKQFGWYWIIVGLSLLLLGSMVDLLDDPPTIMWLNSLGIPFYKGWETALVKKLLGYTLGMGLIAIGFLKATPWLIKASSEQKQSNQRLSVLTEREKEIIKALSNGYSNRQLADFFKVSPKTVDSHLYNIYRKIGVASRSEAIILALESGISA